jgi:DNA polymerase-3 subunit alpha
MINFSHLRTYTDYSIGKGALIIPRLLKKANADGMNAMAITDYKTISGIFQFTYEASKYNIKPIIGCNINGQLFLAKNKVGYLNLVKLSSLINTSKKKQLFKEQILKSHNGLIVTSGSLEAEIMEEYQSKGIDKAEKLFKWWLDIFGEDFYVEVQRNNEKKQENANMVLLKFAIKYNVEVVATTDSNFKSRAEFNKLFKDLPEALKNTNKVVGKIESFQLESEIELPEFKHPQEFKSSDEYLKFLSYEGIKKRYLNFSSDLEQRLIDELKDIKSMKLANYFLIVQDYIYAARKMNIGVAPGRGAAPSSLVAYSIGITEVDPIKYNLIFERFLNAKRNSFLGIDAEFENGGRAKVIEYIVEKYGKERVAQIIRFDKLTAKLAVKEAANNLKLSRPETKALVELISNDTYYYNSLSNLLDNKLILQKSGNKLISKVLKQASLDEGSIKSTNIHACGIVIAPGPLTNYVPVSTSKHSNLFITQFDGRWIENAGMLKLDILANNSLTKINDTINAIKRNHNIEVEINNIPIDDTKTFNLFKSNDTEGIFQFDSNGIREYLKEFKPESLEDLIALNSLYRPCGAQLIPELIKRKNNTKGITYLHPLLETILKNSYGILIYQEQILQVFKNVAGYSYSDGDIMRRNMGNKSIQEIESNSLVFIKSAYKLHKISGADALKIYDLMCQSSDFAFNRSHSVAYSILAYRMAWLKVNFPREYESVIGK